MGRRERRHKSKFIFAAPSRGPQPDGAALSEALEMEEMAYTYRDHQYFEVHLCPRCQGSGKVAGRRCGGCLNGAVMRNVTCSCVVMGRPTADCMICSGSGVRGWASFHLPPPGIGNKRLLASNVQLGPSPCCEADLYEIYCGQCLYPLARCPTCRRCYTLSSAFVDRCPSCGDDRLIALGYPASRAAAQVARGSGCLLSLATAGLAIASAVAVVALVAF